MEGRGHAVRPLLFPWVGAVIGALWYLWKWSCDRFAVGTLCYAAVGTAIPLLVTGDFMWTVLDTCDALHSYQPRDRKLEILKDSSYRGICSDHACTVRTDFPGRILGDHDTAYAYCDGSRMLPVQSIKRYRSGEFPSAKQEGTLYLFADKAHKRVVKVLCTDRESFAFYLCCGYLSWREESPWQQPCLVLRIITGAAKEFGGITGDTAGYFVTLCEGCVVVAVAIAERLM